MKRNCNALAMVVVASSLCTHHCSSCTPYIYPYSTAPTGVLWLRLPNVSPFEVKAAPLLHLAHAMTRNYRASLTDGSQHFQSSAGSNCLAAALLACPATLGEPEDVISGRTCSLQPAMMPSATPQYHSHNQQALRLKS